MVIQIFSGRIKYPLYKKLNPLWWFGNIDDKPPLGYNALTWALRNPFHNLTFYVIGVADRNYTVYGSDPICNCLADFNKNGGTWAVVAGWLPYVSYTQGRMVFYAGWQPNGKLGFKLTW
jgi:hypothetical protein